MLQRDHRGVAVREHVELPVRREAGNAWYFYLFEFVASCSAPSSTGRSSASHHRIACKENPHA
jgi:hypothetical protein